LPCHFEKNLSSFSLLTMIHYALVFFPSTISAAAFLFPHLRISNNKNKISRIHAHQNDVWEYQMCDMANGTKKGEEKNVFSLLRCTLCAVLSLITCSLHEQYLEIFLVCTEKFVTLHWKVLNYFHVTSLLTFFGIYMHMNMSKRMFEKWRGRKKNKLIRKYFQDKVLSFLWWKFMKIWLGKMKNCCIYYF